MKVKLVIVSVFLLIFVIISIVSGDEFNKESSHGSKCLVVLLKPLHSNINLSSLKTYIELKLRIAGIKVISAEEGLMTDEYGSLIIDSNSDSINVLKAQIIEIENQMNELKTSIVEAKKSIDISSQLIISFNDQTIALKKELEEKKALIVSKDKDIALLQKTQFELNYSLSQQREQISVLKNEKNALYQYMNESISSKNKFIAILIIVLLLTVIALTFRTIKDRCFPQTYKWL